MEEPYLVERALWPPAALVFHPVAPVGHAALLQVGAALVRANRQLKV